MATVVASDTVHLVVLVTSRIYLATESSSTTLLLLNFSFEAWTFVVFWPVSFWPAKESVTAFSSSGFKSGASPDRSLVPSVASFIVTANASTPSTGTTCMTSASLISRVLVNWSHSLVTVSSLTLDPFVFTILMATVVSSDTVHLFVLFTSRIYLATESSSTTFLLLMFPLPP